MMRMAGFKQAVKKLAKGKYHVVRHEIDVFTNGEAKHAWSGYIQGGDWPHGSSTPEVALMVLKEQCLALK